MCYELVKLDFNTGYSNKELSSLQPDAVISIMVQKAASTQKERNTEQMEDNMSAPERRDLVTHNTQ